MNKRLWLFMAILAITVLAACSDDNSGNNEEIESEELKTLEVDFEVPETADAGETVELKATVTYGDEKVKDADEVEFEYWEKGNEDDSTMIEANNNEDGSYTAEVTFENDGVYEMYAHTTARDMHNMPKKSITVGEGASQEAEDHNGENGEHHANKEGFDMHFLKPEDVKVNQETDLTVHLQMDNQPLTDANVQYEILAGSDSEEPEWAEAEEMDSGEYNASYTFDQAGTYTITIHVKNDEGLHEHDEYQVVVND